MFEYVFYCDSYYCYYYYYCHCYYCYTGRTVEDPQASDGIEGARPVNPES